MNSSMPSPVRDFAEEVADERRLMNQLFCVIYCSEDGDISLQMVTREILLQWLKDEHYGKVPITQLKNGERINCQQRAGLYIIKGESVVPTEKKVVTEWEV